MKQPKSLPRLAAMKHLPAIQQKFLSMARHHRSEYLRMLRRIKALGKARPHKVLIAFCAAGLLVAGTTNVSAAEANLSVSAPALFNQANAEQRAGRLGSAILGYERARFLAPRDKAIAQNLRTAREKAGVAGPVIPAWQRPTHWLGFDCLAILGSSALFFMGAVLFSARYFPAVSRRAATSLAVTAGAIMLLAGSAVILRWSELDRAVIQSAHATAHIAPASTAQGAFELKAGDLVTAKREYGDFVLVHTLDQRSGWVSKPEIERIIPATSNLSPM
jgi:hypothetical protein